MQNSDFSQEKQNISFSDSSLSSSPFTPSKSTIPANRLMLYAFIFSLLPIVATWFFVSGRINHVQKILHTQREKIGDVNTLLSEQLVNRKLMVSFSEKDPFYLSKYIEAIHPLQKEEALLKSSTEKGGVPESSQQERRLKYISSNENHFSFVESAATITPLYKETTETQNKSIEIDEEDLIEILTRVEGAASEHDITAFRPQMFIIEGSLDRKKGYDKEAWAFSMKILKRVYTVSSTPNLSAPILP